MDQENHIFGKMKICMFSGKFWNNCVKNKAVAFDFFVGKSKEFKN